MNYDTEIQIHKNAIGSKTKLQESLLEAVQILHDGFIVNEKIPKTLECRIADDSKKDEGIYIVDYMNNKFEVNCFLDETFNVNDIVCVLVPDGDFAKTKIIIGSSDGSGEAGDQATKTELNEAVTTLQENFQAGVDAIGAACTRKGSPPASHSLEDTVAAIDAIQTGGNYMTKEIREDGTYYASDDGVDAYDVVVVSKDVGQPHTVVFYDIDGTTILKTQTNVPYHGSASCTSLDGTIIQGQYFKGWNPSPTDIVRDTFCFPVFGDYIIQSGEIEDDWETICAKKGAGYPLTSYKPLVISVPVTQNTELFKWNATDGITWYTEQPYSVSAFELAMHMVKVAEGEDGTTSSWLSTGIIPVIPTWQGGGVARSESYGAAKANRVHYEGGSAVNGLVFDWGTSPYRDYLNTHFLDQLPISIKSAIKQVNKQYTSFARAPIMGASSASSETKVYKTSLDKIWVPSFKELNTWLSSKGNYNSFMASGELEGIDYTTVQTPSYPNLFLMRTLTAGTVFDLNFITVNNNITNYTMNFNGVPFGFCL